MKDILKQIVQKLKQIGINKDEAIMIMNPLAKATAEQCKKMLEWIESNQDKDYLEMREMAKQIANQ